jgi:hypothetical protein
MGTRPTLSLFSSNGNDRRHVRTARLSGVVMASSMPRLATLSRSEVACCTPNGVKSASNTCDTNIQPCLPLRSKQKGGALFSLCDLPLDLSHMSPHEYYTPTVHAVSGRLIYQCLGHRLVEAEAASRPGKGSFQSSAMCLTGVLSAESDWTHLFLTRIAIGGVKCHLLYSVDVIGRRFTAWVRHSQSRLRMSSTLDEKSAVVGTREPHNYIRAIRMPDQKIRHNNHIQRRKDCPADPMTGLLRCRMPQDPHYLLQ